MTPQKALAPLWQAVKKVNKVLDGSIVVVDSDLFHGPWDFLAAAILAELL